MSVDTGLTLVSECRGSVRIWCQSVEPGLSSTYALAYDSVCNIRRGSEKKVQLTFFLGTHAQVCKTCCDHTVNVKGRLFVSLCRVILRNYSELAIDASISGVNPDGTKLNVSVDPGGRATATTPCSASALDSFP